MANAWCRILLGVAASLPLVAPSPVLVSPGSALRAARGCGAWLARRLGQVSAFGAFLDPVADKLLVCAALVLLLELNRVGALVAVIIIGREIAISALREWMASAGARASVAVHSVGKLKTAAQLISIPMLLFHQPLFGVVPTQRIGTWLIWVAAGLTLWSMFYYLRQAWPHLRDAQ